MAFSKDAFVSGFITETREHLDSINDGIIKLKNNPKDRASLSSVLRDLHTIKGTSRMLNFTTVEQLAHGLEDVFNGIRSEKYELTAHIIQLTFLTADFMTKILERIRAGKTDEVDISAYLKLYEKASAGMFFTTDELEKKNKKNTSVEKAVENIGNLENVTSIRVELSRIDEVIRSFDNLIIRQFRFKHQLEEFEENLINSNVSGEAEFPRQLKEDMVLVENAIFEAQRQILDLRMLPLDMVLTPIKKEAEAESLRLQKDIEIDIPKTDFMLDKTILEEMQGILLHLMRNSLDHGIENKDERVSSHKSERGKFSIHATQISNYVKITVKDDGRGLDYDKIRKKAVSMNLMQEQQIMEMSERELQQFLFQSGFSTRESVSELSGRGVGLDVVRIGMERIKGKVHINSKRGEGTSFELTIPLSLATQQGLFVYSGNMKFMIPSQFIAEIIDSDSAKFSSMQGQKFISVRNVLIPVYYLSTLLGADISREAYHVIIVEYLETKMAICVDKMEEYSNVVVTPLPPIMQQVNALQGVVYDEKYAIIPILNISDIMQRLKGLVAYDMKRYQARTEVGTRTILVVDDSVTTRQIEQTIFEKDGYNVEVAGDGIEALEKLRVKHIDAIVTDIEMPRMNGNILLDNIRRSEEYSKIPVIVVSGAYDRESRQQFLDAGAQDYIVKSDFQRGNLLQSVKELLGE